MKLPTALLAIAIEDTVDLWFLPDSRKYEQIIPLSEPIPEPQLAPEDKRKHYLASVYALIYEMLASLQQKVLDKCQIHTEIGDLFNSIGSIVVSVPGVVHAHRVLKQIPLWNAAMGQGAENAMEWSPDDHAPRRHEFDFPKEIGDIAESLIAAAGQSWRSTERARFESVVFVVNDMTACAAFEYRKRETQRNSGDQADFAFVKMHNGVNVGVVERNYIGDLVLKPTHAESGHGFPLIHPQDHEAGFGGSCHFHGRCFEGLLAIHSFYERSIKGGSPLFEAWNRRLTSIGKKLSGQERDNALLEYILGTDKNAAAGQGEGIELIAYYAAQLVHQLAIGPLGPSQIVIGGRMATPSIIERIRENVKRWSNGYPHRDSLGAKIDSFIVLSRANALNDRQSEVQGALVIAYAQIHSNPPTAIRLLNSITKAQP